MANLLTKLLGRSIIIEETNDLFHIYDFYLTTFDKDYIIINNKILYYIEYTLKMNNIDEKRTKLFDTPLLVLKVNKKRCDECSKTKKKINEEEIKISLCEKHYKILKSYNKLINEKGNKNENIL